MKSQISSKTGRIGSLFLGLCPLDCIKKPSVWLCHDCNLFSFDWIFLKFVGKVAMDEILDEFENRPGMIINLTVTSP